MLKSIKETLMSRDGISEQEAQNLIEEAREAFFAYLEDHDEDSAYNICEEYFGLEPDYLTEII